MAANNVTPPPDPAELARQLLAAGHSPQDLMAAIAARMTSTWEMPKREPATLLPRRDEVVRFVLRVDLNGSRPKIWRRVTVPSDLDLEHLHTVIQAAMGWTDSHLHAFLMGTGSRNHRVTPFLTAYETGEGEQGLAEKDVRLDETLSHPGDRLYYDYDFGDDWEHTLKLEAVEESTGEPIEPHVTGGRRACPPEDVGGIGHYNDVVAALGGSAQADDWLQETLDWLPAGFDPAEFDMVEADEEVTRVTLGAAVSVAEQAETVRRLSILLDLIGPDGVDLTAAGYLKPALVERLAHDTGISDTWIGKVNQEDQTWPVADLRETARSLGLIRKSRHRLLLTRAGLYARTDSQALHDLLADQITPT